MAADTHAGTRIRERRLDLGLRQADLAQDLGISPSYLNLIEHNRRRIAGPLLSAVGRALDVDPTLLTQGASRFVLDQLNAAAATSATPPENDRTEELAARYPGWAALIADQHSRIATLEMRIAELTDRMTHDPELATSMHAVISAVTSIRSTASILTSGERLDADWIQRFHKNIDDDAARLAESSEALVRYLDAPTDTDVPLSPADEVSQFLASVSFHVAALEQPNGSVKDVVKSAGLGSIASEMLRDELIAYQRRAKAMPRDAFTQSVIDTGFDPDVISCEFNVSFHDVLMRRSTLIEAKNIPEVGFVICDGSGTVLLQKALRDVATLQSGSACPLWPVFTALSQPERPIGVVAVLPGQQMAKFQCYAVATRTGGGLHMPPSIRSTMLISSLQDTVDDPVLPVGPNCRICPRDQCHARREPSALSVAL